MMAQNLRRAYIFTCLSSISHFTSECTHKARQQTSLKAVLKFSNKVLAIRTLSDFYFKEIFSEIIPENYKARITKLYI